MTRVKQLEIGVDTAEIDKWASSHYIEHLLSKKENQTMASSSHFQERTDNLFLASQANQPFNAASAGRQRPKETGIKINVGQGYAKKEEKEDTNGDTKMTAQEEEEAAEEMECADFQPLF